MIFDSLEFETLRSKYADEPDYNVPMIVLLGRRDDFVDERSLLEASIQKVSLEKQKEWLGRLFAKEEDQFLSVWFEIMLFDWLQSSGQVEVEPELLGNRPDFLVNTGKQEIVIEAKAFLRTQSERNQSRWQSAVFSAFDQVKLPYIVAVKAARLVALPDICRLIAELRDWLTKQPQEKFTFEDHFGNIIVCESQFEPTLDHAFGAWTAGQGQRLNPDVLKPALQEKAKTNKGIRHKGYPYIIAIFIENFLFSVEEVIDAWFGNEVFVIDVNRKQVIETKRDRRGLYLYRNQISHRSVSGTLVFKDQNRNGFRGRSLQGWFIENPYAKVQVDSSIFPVESSFLVQHKDNSSYQMGWKQGKEQSF